MAQAEVGKDGAYRMIIENRYKQLAGVRRDSKLLSVLAGFYGVTKLALASLPVLVYGQQLDPVYVASIVSILLAFMVFSAGGFAGSGAGKPQREKGYLLWMYVFVTAIIGSKAVLDAWNNPYARALLMMSSPPKATPYDQPVAKFLVQKLDLTPEEAIRDVDMVNLALDGFGAFALLASGAATSKYLLLKRQPKVKVQKKES